MDKAEKGALLVKVLKKVKPGLWEKTKYQVLHSLARNAIRHMFVSMIAGYLEAAAKIRVRGD